MKEKYPNRWKPGQSGNPAGRPKKEKALTELLRKEGSKRDQTYIDPKTGEEKVISRKRKLAQKIWELALSGDLAAIKYIFDRIDGSPRQSVSLEQEGRVVIEFDDPLDRAVLANPKNVSPEA